MAALNAFARTEAETIAWETGIETEVCSEGGLDVTAIDDGDFIKVKEVEFGSGATSFAARVASVSGGGAIELRLDSENGTLIGTCAVPSTAGEQTWATESCAVSGAAGKHDLFLKLTGGGFKVNWWQFAGPGDPGMAVGTGGTGSLAGASGASGIEPAAGGGGGGAAGGTFAIGGAPSQPTGPDGRVSTGGVSEPAPGALPASNVNSSRSSCGVVRARSQWSALAAIGLLGALALRSSRRRRNGRAPYA